MTDKFHDIVASVIDGDLAILLDLIARAESKVDLYQLLEDAGFNFKTALVEIQASGQDVRAMQETIATVNGYYKQVIDHILEQSESGTFTVLERVVSVAGAKSRYKLVSQPVKGEQTSLERVQSKLKIRDKLGGVKK